MQSNFLNIIPECAAPLYRVSQGDSGRTIRCNLYEGVIAYELDGTEDIKLRYRKPNGDISSIPVDNTSDSYVDIAIPSAMTDVAGLVYCKLRINNIGAKAFLINVERKP